jgi:hypothetical protein
MSIDDVADVCPQQVENCMKDAVKFEHAGQHNMLEVSAVAVPAWQPNWKTRMNEQQRGEDVQLLADFTWQLKRT